MFYVVTENERESKDHFRLCAAYAVNLDQTLQSVQIGEGLLGQCAKEKRPIFLQEVPDDYMKVGSGLGHEAPNNVYLLPIIFEQEVRGIIEIASFTAMGTKELTLLEESVQELGVILENVLED